MSINYHTISLQVTCAGSVISYFFFSSRRRHTRFDCDWSSDVCSSDLSLLVLSGAAADLPVVDEPRVAIDVDFALEAIAVGIPRRGLVEIDRPAPEQSGDRKSVV